MKYYGCIPIRESFDGVKLNYDSLEPTSKRHLKRYIDALTELIANLGQIDNKELRELMLKYDVSLIKNEDGSYKVGIGFPEKRFY